MQTKHGIVNELNEGTFSNQNKPVNCLVCLKGNAIASFMKNTIHCPAACRSSHPDGRAESAIWHKEGIGTSRHYFAGAAACETPFLSGMR